MSDNKDELHTDRHIENINAENKPGVLKQAILDNLHFIQGRSSEFATLNDWYMAVAYTVRDKMMKNWIDSLQSLRGKDLKIVGYLSAEFLMGPHLGNALINLGIFHEVKNSVENLGLDFNILLKQEEEPGLAIRHLGHRRHQQRHVVLVLTLGHRGRVLAGRRQVAAVSGAANLDKALRRAAYGADLPSERRTLALRRTRVAERTQHVSV